MSISRTPKEMGSGYIGAGTVTVVGPVPANTAYYVNKLDLYNSHTADVVVQLLVNQDGTARPWKRVLLDADGGHAEMIVDKPVLLQVGGRIQAVATVHSTVSYTANGIEEVES